MFSAVEEIPIMTSLQSTNDVLPHINSMLTEVNKLNIKKFHRFLDAGLEEDDYKETLNNLESLQNCYIDNSDML